MFLLAVGITVIVALILISVAVTVFISNKRPEGRPSYFWNSRQTSSVYGPEQTGLVLLSFYKHWTSKWGQEEKVFNTLNNLNIEWLDKPWEVGESTVYGQCTSKKDIRVWRGLKLNDVYKISRTVLIYQLLHVVLYNLYNDPYYGIKNSDYKEWLKQYNDLIRNVSEDLKSQGL